MSNKTIEVGSPALVYTDIDGVYMEFQACVLDVLDSGLVIVEDQDCDVFEVNPEDVTIEEN